ncbi:MAG: ABC transporter permease, partial [Chloroflexota bacterium]
LGVITAIFLLVHLSGDPVAGLVPPGASEVDRNTVRQAYGLNRPLAEQYGLMLKRLMSGDLGESWRQGRPALTAVVERLPASLLLTLSALTIATIVGIGVGLLAGSLVYGWADYLVRMLSVTGQSIPTFLLGVFLVLAFAVNRQWFPASGFTTARSLVLPAVTLAVFPTALIARLVRSGTAEAMASDYVRTARGKGLSQSAVLVRHVLKNALIPALGYVGFQAAFLFGGAVVVEQVFAYPGMGLLALNAAADRDLPVIEAYVVVVALLLIMVNAAVGIVSLWLDPRIGEVTK